MQHENDYILRETQKVSMLLASLISKVSTMDFQNFESSSQAIDSDLEGLDLTLSQISAMSEAELMNHIEDYGENNIEQFAELLVIIANQPNSSYSQDLVNKSNFLLDWLDNNSETLSLKRLELQTKIKEIRKQ